MAEAPDLSRRVGLHYNRKCMNIPRRTATKIECASGVGKNFMRLAVQESRDASSFANGGLIRTISRRRKGYFKLSLATRATRFSKV